MATLRTCPCGISAASGIGLSGAAAAAAFAVAALAAYGFWRRVNRARVPLVDPILLRIRQISAGLVGALGGYLVLFGPLVLVPDVLGPGHGAARAGLVLTALPLGFAAGALGANRVLPRGWSDRRRALIGSAVAAAALAALIPLPANNTLVMGAIPARAAGMGGGLVNMTRGLGTALGVALVTLALYLVPDPGRAAHGATALLAVVAVGVFAGNLPHPRAAGRGTAEPLEL